MTIESNKLIAEFMGLKYYDLTKENYLVLGKHLSPEQIPYHTSWDWLMPVVKKVIQEDCDFLVFEELKYQLWRVDIDAVYSAVVEFIKNQKN